VLGRLGQLSLASGIPSLSLSFCVVVVPVIEEDVVFPPPWEKEEVHSTGPLSLYSLANLAVKVISLLLDVLQFDVTVNAATPTEVTKLIDPPIELLVNLTEVIPPG
jgi:hypothetical protein